MRRYTFRDNLISALIGVMIGIPVSVCAWHSWTNSNDTGGQINAPKKEVEFEALTSLEILPIAGASKAFEIYEMTPEELAEEYYCDSLELLACIVMAEAESEDLMGKRMVVDVVLNRVDDPNFPDTIYGVLTQKYHFSSYWDGRYAEVDPSEDCFTAVIMELEERTYPSILYFTAGRYNDYGTPWKQYGNHYFSTK